MQEFFPDFMEVGFSMSENPLAASNLFLGGHVTRYNSHFEKFKSALHKYRF